MVSEQELKQGGYRPWPNSLAQDAGDARFWQKIVKDQRGPRYFIDIHEYNWQQWPQRPGPEITYEPRVVLYGQDGECVMHVTVCDTKATASLASLETYLDQLWHKLDCGYYELRDQ